MNWKKISAITLSSSIVFGGIAPFASAVEAASVSKSVQVQSASSSSSSNGSTVESNDSESISIEKFIKRINELFPNRFKSANQEDFRLDFAPYYPGEEEDVERFRISYFDRSSQNPTHASFEFTGEDLELTNFYYSPDDRSDALFPPKVSEEEALKVAKAFLEKVKPNTSYEFNQNSNVYYNDMNRPLTEPIEYRFSFDKLKDGIPIENQSAYITVLGNGEITQFYGQRPIAHGEFEAATGIMSEEVLVKKLKEDIDVELQYVIRRNYNTEESTVFLTYREEPAIRGISATNGKYNINGEFVEELPEKNELKTLPASQKEIEAISRDEAKAIAEKLLETEDEDTVLQIEGVIERELPDGTVVYEINYMYRKGNSGFGSSIQIKKDTGELLRFHASRDYNPNEKIEENVTYEEALEKAVEYINDYAYTNMEEYAYPTTSEQIIYGFNDYQHRFNFPRVKDGLIVAGDYISVGISKENGSLESLNIQHSDIDEWPSVNDVISKEQALKDIKSKVDLKLYYVNERRNEKNADDETLNYNLVYLRDHKNPPTFYNAVSGKWESSDPNRGEASQGDGNGITHPWAEKELNFMIDNNIIEVEDPKTFNGDKVVTKGEALEILSKSLTRIYQSPYTERENSSPFTNIDSDHPLFEIVKRSVETGILDTDNQIFNVDEKLTRENLAYWYVRALGLNQVAKRHSLFKYDFTDTEAISDNYRGYVALANSLGLLTSDNENRFSPKDEVTLAQLAVANLRLAKLVTSEDFQRRY